MGSFLIVVGILVTTLGYGGAAYMLGSIEMMWQWGVFAVWCLNGSIGLVLMAFGVLMNQRERERQS